MGARYQSGAQSQPCIVVKASPSNLFAVPSYLSPPPLLQELSLYQRLSHPNIVTYLGSDYSELESSLYIFLEYVAGGSLASILSGQ